MDVSTGRQLPVPAGVNTGADEFHPALRSDGLLSFTRATLLTQLNGNILPPAERAVVLVNRKTDVRSSVLGGVPAGLIVTNKGAGATFTRSSGESSVLAYGTRPDPLASGAATRPIVTATTNSTGFTFRSDLSLNGNNFAFPPSGQFLDFPHVSAHLRGNVRGYAISTFSFSAGDGTVRRGATALLADHLNASGQVVDRDSLVLGSATQTVNRATPRIDGYVALDSSTDASSDIRTIQFPGESQPIDAPAPITTAAPERMPAWSVDGVQLGFVRTTGATPRRELLVYDTTAGIQSILNPGIYLGGEPPTPQLRAFQNTWGGLSLAFGSDFDAPPPTLICTGGCLASIGAQTVGVPLTLAPIVTAKKPVTGTKIGILVARVTGTKRVLGRSVPRIAPVGRVPLGAARRGTNRFPWNGRVNGKRLPRGTYLLTFRSLNGKGRILSTSQSVRFTVTASGRITGARIQR